MTGIEFLEMYKVSSYERKIIEILNRENVQFVKEKSFPEVLGKGNIIFPGFRTMNGEGRLLEWTTV